MKVGREPFDPDVRRALEAHNPGVDFDWRAIIETPIPSADADKWRERRRAERAAKHAAAEEEAIEAAAVETEPNDAVATPETSIAALDAAISPVSVPTEQAASRHGDADRKRRRRRRTGDGRGSGAPGASAPPANEPAGD